MMCLDEKSESRVEDSDMDAEKGMLADKDGRE